MTCPLATPAGMVMRLLVAYGEHLLVGLRGVAEREVEFGLVILAAEASLRAPSAPTAMSEEFLEEVGESAGMAARELLPVGRIPIGAVAVGVEALSAAEASEAACLLAGLLLRLELVGMLPVLAVLVVLLTLLGVAQHLVCLVDGLKLFLGRGVVRVQVRMKLARQLAVRLLDVVLRCRFVHSQHLIIINKSHSL